MAFEKGKKIIIVAPEEWLISKGFPKGSEAYITDNNKNNRHVNPDGSGIAKLLDSKRAVFAYTREFVVADRLSKIEKLIYGI